MTILAAFGGQAVAETFLWSVPVDNGSTQVSGFLGENHGSSIATVGDFDGDGRIDYASATHGVVGISLWIGAFDQSPSVDRVLRVSGHHATVAGVGDLDGDGRDDVAVGAPDDGDGVVVLFRSNGKRFVVGEESNGEFGAALSSIGDYNRDGHDDVLVGSPGSNGGTGSAFVVSGRNGDELLRVDGSAPSGRFGEAVVGLGDLDADGLPDFAVGAPYVSGHGTWTGEVRVFSGTGHQLLHPIVGSAWDELGSVLLNVGDVDGDGRNDLAITSARAPSRSARGEVQIVSSQTGEQLLHLSGRLPGDQFGRGLAMADLSDDGRPELLIGSPFADSINDDALNNGGRVDIVSLVTGRIVATVASNESQTRLGWSLCGSPGQLLVGAPGVWTAGGDVLGFAGAPPLDGPFSVHGSGRRDELGTQVAVLGDINQDGVDDYAAAAPDARVCRLARAGYVRLLSGADGSTIDIIEGWQRGMAFGAGLAGAPDLDGDWVPDLIIGAPGYDFQSKTDTGAAFIISGSDRSILGTVIGWERRQQLGFSVSIFGDQDGDYVPEVAVGSPFADAVINRNRVADAGAVTIISGADGQIISTTMGSERRGYLGWSMSTYRDLPGDELPDLVVGEPGYDGGFPRGRGRVHLLSSEGHNMTLEGQHARGQFGFSVSTLGDLHAGGFPELLVGSPGYRGTTGRDTGAVSVFSIPNGIEQFFIEGQSRGDEFGFSVAGIDNRRFAVAAPGASYSERDAGRVTIFDEDATPLVHYDGTDRKGGLGTGLAAGEVLIMGEAGAHDGYTSDAGRVDYVPYPPE